MEGALSLDKCEEDKVAPHRLPEEGWLCPIADTQQRGCGKGEQLQVPHDHHWQWADPQQQHTNHLQKVPAVDQPTQEAQVFGRSTSHPLQLLHVLYREPPHLLWEPVRDQQGQTAEGDHPEVQACGGFNS